MLNKILLGIIVLSFVSCASLKTHKNFDTLIFGQGGGITGEVTGFEITKNTELYSYSRTVHGKVDKKYKLHLSRKNLQEIDQKIELSKALTYSFQEADNFYYFIEIQKGPKKNYISWGGNKSPAKEIKELYDYL